MKSDAVTTSTRDRLLVVAEQLFAEHGVYAVSNRQVSEAAGQGNNAAVGYHFGTKADLVRAIVNKHSAEIERHRCELVAATEGSTEIRDWVTCLVQATTDHLAASPTPTWFARFSAQLITDPSLRSIVYTEAMVSPSLQKTLVELARCLPDLPVDVRKMRADMVRQLMTHMCAEKERAIAESTEEPGDWTDFTTDLVDAMVGLWLAPVTR
ncbi:TetR family transcriptional regulator [Williamsia limnetica]|uniref:TetR family transcriptional regulator n=1 Tax=Williamsia limnetica TaxID=882452 RepID=A0A318RU01_WILLI|nr:TetR family transcriptional regulator [Williamsia limnetica]